MSMSMTDDEFVHAFLHGSLPPTEFHHRDHLRLSWFLLHERGVEESSQMIAAGIRQFAAIEDLEDAQFPHCAALQRRPDLIRSTTCFHWWPKRIHKRQGPRRTVGA